MVNLFIALFWLILGLGLILIPGFDAWRIRGTGLSLGWLAVALAAYNLVRWWLLHGRQRPRREPDADEPPPRQPREYLPDFDFNKDKPDERITS